MPTNTGILTYCFLIIWSRDHTDDWLMHLAAISSSNTVIGCLRISVRNDQIVTVLVLISWMHAMHYILTYLHHGRHREVHCNTHCVCQTTNTFIVFLFCKVDLREKLPIYMHTNINQWNDRKCKNNGDGKWHKNLVDDETLVRHSSKGVSADLLQ